MTADAFKRSLKHHQDRGFFKNLKILRGIERESLRVTQEGKISQSNHPKSLGSPLTSEDITTDFAEALVELVTPTFESAEELFEHLSLLHKFLYSEMEEEILWNFSMPCAFQNEKEIKIAEYGDTNSGMLKHIYRKGLRLRYGSIMQCVSGIHFNFSLSIDSWDTLTNIPDQSFVNEKYLGAIRNIKRNFWFLLERLGASPIAHESYLLNREHSLTKHGSNDLFLPCATSLRMSDVGYQSSMQNALKINYNNLDEFIDAIIKGINTPVKNFEEIGLLDELGVPQQISTGILQIENELYDTVRPKRSGPSGSRPATLLKNEGIEYLELRGIDINPFIPEGIDENKIKLLDIFIMHSLISESPQVSDKEIEEIRANQKTMVENGRSENVNLEQNGVSTPLKELKKIFYDELEQVATAMDEYCPGYSNALSAEMSENLLPSEKIMNEMNAQNLSFQEYGLAQSKKIAAKQQSHAGDDFSKFTLNAKKSLKDFKNLNKNAGMDINKYVELYNSKI
jgi:glutamate--cysteine ligase